MRSFHNRVALTFSVTAAAGPVAASHQACGLGMVAMRGPHDVLPGSAVSFESFDKLIYPFLFFIGLMLVSKGLVDLLTLLTS